MPKDHIKLPKYSNPPVEEVVFDIAFKPLSQFKVPYIGLLWDRYRADYPTCAEQPPLLNPSQPLGVENYLSPRIWLIHEDDSRVIQIQSDRFIFNWRKREGQYPSYDVVFPDFLENLRIFQKFIAENDLGTIEITRIELTYTNNIVHGSGWDKLRDIQASFPDLNWINPDSRFLPNPERLSWVCSFSLPDGKGALTTSLRTGTMKDDKSRVLGLEMKATASAEEFQDDDLDQRFNLFHEWIVLGFQDLTSEEVQKLHWGKE